MERISSLDSLLLLHAGKWNPRIYSFSKFILDKWIGISFCSTFYLFCLLIPVKSFRMVIFKFFDLFSWLDIQYFMMWLGWGPWGTALITFTSPNLLVLVRFQWTFPVQFRSSLDFLTLLYFDLKAFPTISQEAESALNASIQDPIFHRVRDVAPNKVSIFLRSLFIFYSIDTIMSSWAYIIYIYIYFTF